MFKALFLISILTSLISCSVYKTAERHLDNKMKRADLTLHFEAIESGAQIEYWDSGDTSKPALLLVQGFGASSKYQWYKQVKLLTREYRVIAPNLNYFGRTIPAVPDYSVAGQVSTLESLLDHLKVDTCSLMGVSYGGLVGAELAHQTKRVIPKMVLFDTPTKFADSSDLIDVMNYFDSPSIEELFAPSEPEGLITLFLIATGKRRNVPAKFLEEFHQKSYNYNLEDKRKLITGLSTDMELFQQRDYNFDMPILLIWGSEDKVVPVSTGEQLSEYFGENTKLKVVDGAAHMPNITHKREFNIYVELFLDISK